MKDVKFISGILLISFLGFFSCDNKLVESKEPTLFKLLNNEDSGVDFINQLDFKGKFNIYTYRNFYNGGGVGLADINNDGLLDIYFISNMESNKLYLNKGDFKFEDITEQSGIAGKKGWSTGVSMADINGDGVVNLLDVEGFVNH